VFFVWLTHRQTPTLHLFLLPASTCKVSFWEKRNSSLERNFQLLEVKEKETDFRSCNLLKASVSIVKPFLRLLIREINLSTFTVYVKTNTTSSEWTKLRHSHHHQDSIHSPVNQERHEPIRNFYYYSTLSHSPMLLLSLSPSSSLQFFPSNNPIFVSLSHTTRIANPKLRERILIDDSSLLLFHRFTSKWHPSVDQRGTSQKDRVLFCTLNKRPNHLFFLSKNNCQQPSTTTSKQQQLSQRKSSAFDNTCIPNSLPKRSKRERSIPTTDFSLTLFFVVYTATSLELIDAKLDPHWLWNKCVFVWLERQKKRKRPGKKRRDCKFDSDSDNSRQHHWISIFLLFWSSSSPFILNNIYDHLVQSRYLSSSS